MELFYLNRRTVFFLYKTDVIESWFNVGRGGGVLPFFPPVKIGNQLA